jgi:hypothetical protein
MEIASDGANQTGVPSMIRRFKILSTLAAVSTALIGLQSPVMAALIDPSDAALTNFIIQQGDFNTVGLNYAAQFTGNNYTVQPNDMDIWVITNTGATNGPGIDDPYNPPSGTSTNPPSDYYFQTGLTATGGLGCTTNCATFPDPGGALEFAGDTAVTWDANIADLNSSLNGESMVIYFFMNEQASGDDTLWGLDELVWTQVTLVDTDGVLEPTTYYLTNIPNPTALNQGSGPDPSLGTCNVDPNNPYSGNAGCLVNNVGDPITSQNGTAFSTDADERWTYVSGYFCADATTGAILAYGRCHGQANGVDIENNLGNNQAGFAMWNDDLNAIIANNGCVTGGCYDVLQADIHISMTDNGFESIGIAGNGTPPPPQIPEPTSLAVLGTALAALGVWRHRRRMRHDV